METVQTALYKQRIAVVLESQQSLSQGEFDQTLLGYEPIYEGDIVYTLSITVLGKAQLVTVLVYQYIFVWICEVEDLTPLWQCHGNA